MKPLKSLFSLLLCFAWTAFPGAPASACEPGPGGVWNRTSLIVDGADEVPLNALPVVTYDGDGVGVTPPLGEDLQLLEGDTQTPVELVIESLPSLESSRKLFRLRPKQPLMPETTYRLADRRGPLPCGPMKPCAGGSRMSFAVFRTGKVQDLEAPKFSGVSGLKTYKTACDNSACCGPYSATLVDVQWTNADESDDSVLYAVFVNEKLVSYSSGPTTFSICGSHPSYQNLPAGTVRVVAVDSSGNMDDNSATKVLNLDRCGLASSPIDAGVDASVNPDVGAADAGGMDAGANSTDEQACGCRLGGRRHRGGTTMLVCLTMTALAFTRRQKRAPPLPK